MKSGREASELLIIMIFFFVSIQWHSRKKRNNYLKKTFEFVWIGEIIIPQSMTLLQKNSIESYYSGE
jgi:hypothetical protein